MTDEEFGREYRAAMGWRTPVIHDAELTMEYPVCRYRFSDGTAVTAVCPDIPLEDVPPGCGLMETLAELFDLEQVRATPERVLGFYAPKSAFGEDLPAIGDAAALDALLGALDDRDRAWGEVAVSDDFTACILREGRMLAAAGALRLGKLADISLCVHPLWRGQGLGSRVLCALLRKIQRAGCIPLYRVEEGNAPSVRLARRVGLAQGYAMEGALLTFPEG